MTVGVVNYGHLDNTLILFCVKNILHIIFIGKHTSKNKVCTNCMVPNV